LTEPVFVDADGARATQAAIASQTTTGSRGAVWVGEAEDPELAEMRAELERRA
jgi:hypothetical protein